MKEKRVHRYPRRHADPGCGSLLLPIIMVFLLLIAGGVQGAKQIFPPSPAIQPTFFPTHMPTMDKAHLLPINTMDQTASDQHLAKLPAIAIPTADSAMIISPLQLAESNPHLVAKLDRIIDTIANTPQNPGIVMLLDVPEQGQWIAARGLADRETKTPVQPSDRFRIASVTKMFVATLVLQLAQEGKLTLDDTIEYWLPGLVPNGHQIHLRQLLNQTSGLYDYLDWEFEQKYFTSPRRVWQPREMVQHGVAHPPYFTPGEPGKWHYSNTNYILLGMVIEEATGSTLVEALHQRICEPLGLKNTFLEEQEEIPGGFVHGYIGDKDYTGASLSAWAAGGMISNVEDVATFVRALFTGTLLKPEMLQEMLTSAKMDFPQAHIIGYPIYGLGITPNIEALALATMAAAPTETTFDVVWGHIGGLSGFKSVVGYQPKSGIIIVVLINQMYTPVVPVAIQSLQVAQ